MKKILFLSMVSSGALMTALAGLVFQKDLKIATCAYDQPLSAFPSSPAFVSTDTMPPLSVWTLDQIPERTENYPSVGTVTLYGNSINPGNLVLFLSGDGGWNQGVIDMAKALAQDGQTLIVGIDVIKYYKILQTTKAECLYPAGDLENLSEFVQKKLNLTDYHKPVLVGYSSGATLTYALLCQAPAGTFKGGIVLGFCPDIELNKPLCEGSGKLSMSRLKSGRGFEFTDHAAPAAPLEVMHGELDKDCNCQTTCNFFDKVKNVRVVRLPKVGHGFGVSKNWLPQFKQAFAHLLAISDSNTGQLSPYTAHPIPVEMASIDSENDAAELPLVITRAATNASTPLVLFLSGDGGWTSFDQQICDQLAGQQIPTVGLNCQSYFWKKKTPEQTVNELVPIIRQYLSVWGKSTFIFVGYSFGANIVPFIQNRLPADLRQKVQKIVLLSPDVKGDFEIHVAGMLGQGGGPYDVSAEVRSLQNIPVLCVTGEQEGTEMQTSLQGANQLRFERIPGSHHYNNDAVKVASTIISK